ncbi:DUF3298 and DUF4163 domain-containing protein [candidate division WOR-3 bacterium]|nr:DUF3298 and DUF4163 domain-containing protein [candidate division WOR-3 bacterium]
MRIKNTLALILFTAIFGTAISSCLKFDVSRSELSADSVEYSIHTIVRSIDGGSGAYIEIDSFYASKAPNNSADSINHYTKSMTYPEGLGYQIMIDTFMAQYSNSLAEYPDMFAWESQMKVSVILNKSGIFSMAYNYYEYTGGAHPNSWTYFLNFDLSTGKPIRFEEIFTRDEIVEINKRAEIIFRDTYGLDPEGSLDEAGYWFDNDKFSLNTNFAVQKNSLLFLFNSYEIAPYVAGPSEVEIPYNEIEDLIGDDNPLRRLIL